MNSFTVDAPDQITASITIAADTPVSARNVEVVTPGGTGRLYSGFGVEEVAVRLPSPDQISPVNKTRTNNTTPSLDWSDVSAASAVTYHLQIDNNSDYSSPLLTKVGLTSSQYALTTGEALAPGVWYWRVRAVDGAGNASAWNGGYWKFIVV